MNIKLADFFEIVTYNGLHDYVDLPSHIATQCLLDDPEHKEVFVEPLSPTLVRCYWPIESWIKELKRRKEVELTLTECAKLHITPTTEKDNETDLRKAIIYAAANGNFEEVNKLNDRLQLLIHTK